MTDNKEEQNHTVSTGEDPQPETESKTPTTMAETEEPPQQQSEADNSKPHTYSFSIWPPSQRTRDAVVNRLIETLSSPSVLSKRYGTMPQEEASATARSIEDDAFSSAAASVSTDDDGIEILQVYSKEISKRMLDAVKSRSAAVSVPENASPSPVAVPTNTTTSPSEEASYVANDP